MTPASLRISTSRIAPERATSHRINGRQIFKPIPIETWEQSVARESFAWADQTMLGYARAIVAHRRLPYSPTSASDTWTRETGLLRLRRSWTDRATGDRWILEVEAQAVPSAVSRAPSRPIKERVVGPVAYHDTGEPWRLGHQLAIVDRQTVCSCGERLPRHRTPDPRHQALLEAAGLWRTIGPTPAILR